MEDLNCGKPSDLESMAFAHGGILYAQGEDKYVCVRVPGVLSDAVSIPVPGYAEGLRAAFPSSQRKGCDSS